MKPPVWKVWFNNESVGHFTGEKEAVINGVLFLAEIRDPNLGLCSREELESHFHFEEIQINYVTLQDVEMLRAAHRVKATADSNYEQIRRLFGR